MFQIKQILSLTLAQDPAFEKHNVCELGCTAYCMQAVFSPSCAYLEDNSGSIRDKKTHINIHLFVKK